MWDLIVSVPDHCLSFYFPSKRQPYQLYYSTCLVSHTLDLGNQCRRISDAAKLVLSPLSILILTVPRRYFCRGSLAVHIYNLVHLIC